MIRKLFFAALIAGFGGAASAATLDFTADNAIAGNILGTSWTVTSNPVNSLTNATHKNNVGCTGQGWDFACAGSGPYDVGFGVKGFNNNEVDGRPASTAEFVQVSFGTALKVTGFAGMLTYSETAPAASGAREIVWLSYRVGGGAWQGVAAEPLFVVDQFPNTGGRFDTVGLAFRNDVSFLADEVRFYALGVGDSDDGTANVTAAGLQLQAVPVPAAFPLLLMGVGAFGIMGRRKARAAA